MKRILGLDLGTTSIGWAVVNEAETKTEKSSIVKLGVRLNPLTVDEFQNFEKGKSITTNADRTLKRSMRRSLQRYKLRRDALRKLLKENGFIDDATILAESGNSTTFETYHLRAKAATQEISLAEFARVLLMINKKRGYKSSRKANSNEEGQAIDSLDIAKILNVQNLTPGQYVLAQINKGNMNVPDFYQSDLQAEFNKIWDVQKGFYPQLTDELKDKLKLKNSKQTWGVLKNPLKLEGIKRTTKGQELKKEDYTWRVEALTKQINLEQLAVVLQNINGQIANSSGYLGKISDRSKELFFNNQTVGQYQMAMLQKNPHYSLRNQVFYRKDYFDEFNRIWETQAQFHKELTDDLKNKIRDIVIFYQRPLRSQKHLVSICELESKKIQINKNGTIVEKLVGHKVCPKSSPYFQEFKILQNLNNVEVTDCNTGEVAPLTKQEKEKLLEHLSIYGSVEAKKVLEILHGKAKDFELNFEKLEGNRTGEKLYNAYKSIVKNHYPDVDFNKKSAKEIRKIVAEKFGEMGVNQGILSFDSALDYALVETQPYFKLWHLLYSYEGDKSQTGNDSLVKKILEICGGSVDETDAKVIANVVFEEDYGSLSAKAIKKILPYLHQGLEYSEACKQAGYNHSKRSLTKEELENKIYKDHLEILPKNSLRNPVVEKILNQMVNVVNEVIDTYGKPDEVRIELARELKKNAKEREEMTKSIAESTKQYDEYRKILQKEFGIERPSRNDLLRYKLYKELDSNSYKTLYSNTYIPQEKLFSKEFDIEHIIPQARRFDDSFGNKTLESRQANIEKGAKTAFDYVQDKYGEKAAEEYKLKIEDLYKKQIISKTKFKNLLMTEKEIPEGFIERDLRDSQYIAKKAREMLEDLVKFVVPTTGSITDRLREDWQLVDVMKELNFDKYQKIGLVETYKNHDNKDITVIKDWTKRNDHRHHAMDALTIAFTKHSFIQYLNNLNARTEKVNDLGEYKDLSRIDLSDLKPKERTNIVYAIQQAEMYKSNKGHYLFKPPMPLNEFRAEAKQQLENILVSIKAKNKVVTKNTNVIKVKSSKKKQETLTPRSQLHNETVYGSMKQEIVKVEKVDSKMTAEKIATVCHFKYREALLKRLLEFDGDAKKAFAGKNALVKNPIYLNDLHTDMVPEKVKTKELETIYTIRKAIDASLNVEKVIDAKVKKILQDRLIEFGGDAKAAFENLDENPIWLNKEKGIAIKRVTITGVSNAVALHKDANGKPIDFVSTSGNHHVAIFCDKNGDLQEHIVSYFEATQRANQGLPIVNKEYNKEEGYEFLFTMKQNEYFVFANEQTGFDPNKIDLMDPANYAQISPNLFRVQKLATKNYTFRHHLETNVDEKAELRDLAWKRIQTTNKLKFCKKVRINHVGQVVAVGEY